MREGCLGLPSTRLIVILEGAQRLKDLAGGNLNLHLELTELEKQLHIHGLAR